MRINAEIEDDKLGGSYKPSSSLHTVKSYTCYVCTLILDMLAATCKYLYRCVEFIYFKIKDGLSQQDAPHWLVDSWFEGSRSGFCIET